MLTDIKQSKPYGKILLFTILFSPLFQACGVFNPSRMLHADKNFESATFLDTQIDDFVIRQGDVLNVHIYPKSGYNLIESQIVINDRTVTPQGNVTSLEYTIDQKGEANLPILGLINLNNLTIRAAELKLTEAYKAYYIEPYVNIKVVNKYVTVYRGTGEAKKVQLDRPDITVIEAIGMAGGIPENGKSAKVKVIRNLNGNPTTEIIDLSDINAIAKGQAYVKPNDIIYIDPVINTTVFREVAPIITSLSSIIVIYAFFVNLNK